MQAATHTGFIVAAYAIACGIVGGLLAWVMADYRAQLRNLAELEKQGITRRSASASWVVCIRATLRRAYNHAAPAKTAATTTSPARATISMPMGWEPRKSGAMRPD